MLDSSLSGRGGTMHELEANSRSIRRKFESPLSRGLRSKIDGFARMVQQIVSSRSHFNSYHPITSRFQHDTWEDLMHSLPESLINAGLCWLIARRSRSV